MRTLLSALFLFAATLASAQVTPVAQLVSGANQSAVAGQTLAQPFKVRVTDAVSGRALEGRRVRFFCCGGPTSGFVLASGAAVSSVEVGTDFTGYAESPPVRVPTGLGPSEGFAVVLDGSIEAPTVVASFTIPFTVTSSTGATSLALQDMWWGGLSQNGWGASVVQHDQRMFVVFYAYGDAGQPTWFVLPDGQWAAGQRYQKFQGNFYHPRSSPYYEYFFDNFKVGKPIGFTELDFNAVADAGKLVHNGPILEPFERDIFRQDFRTPTPAPLTGLGDMWWGGLEQNGWGISILEQPGGLFIIWYTYDSSGYPVWFVMSSGTWTSNNKYEGKIYKALGTAWPFYHYYPQDLRVFEVGTFSLTFADLQHATFTYNNTAEGHKGTMPLVRQPF